MSYSDYIYSSAGGNPSTTSLEDSALLSGLLEGVEALTELVNILNTKVDQWEANNTGIDPTLTTALASAQAAYDTSFNDFVVLEQNAANLAARTQFLSVAGGQLVVAAPIRMGTNSWLEFPNGDHQADAYTQQDAMKLANMASHFGALPAQAPASTFLARLEEMETKTQFLTVSGGELHCSENLTFADGKKIYLPADGEIYFGSTALDQATFLSWMTMRTDLTTISTKLGWFDINGTNLTCNYPLVTEEITILPKVNQDPKLNFIAGAVTTTQISAPGTEPVDFETRITALETKTNTFSLANGAITFTTPIETEELTATKIYCDSIEINGDEQTIAFLGAADPVYAGLTALDAAIFLAGNRFKLTKNVEGESIHLKGANSGIIYPNGSTQSVAPPLADLQIIKDKLTGVNRSGGRTYITDLTLQSADGTKQIHFTPVEADPAANDTVQTGPFTESMVAAIREKRFNTVNFTSDSSWGLHKNHGSGSETNPDTIDSPTTYEYVMKDQDGNDTWPYGWYALNILWGISGLTKLKQMTMTVKVNGTVILGKTGFELSGNSTSQVPAKTEAIPQYRFYVNGDGSSISITFTRGMERDSGATLALQEFGFATLEYVGRV